MKKLLVVLLALALPVAADGPVVCSAVGPVTTTWSESVESAAAGLACDRPADGGEEAEPSVYDDAVALWKLDEASGTRADSIGSNDLTDNNTVGSTSKGVGAPANLPDTVASFVAANSEYLSVTENTLLNGDIDWTVSLWVYRAAAGVDPVVSRENGATRSILLRGDGATSDASLFTRDYNDSVTKGGALTAGVWHNLIAWHDSVANEIGVSVDAGTPATASTGGANTTPNGTLAVGGRIANSYFTGQLSTVVIWPRVLTSDERTALYNSGAGAPLP